MNRIERMYECNRDEREPIIKITGKPSDQRLSRQSDETTYLTYALPFEHETPYDKHSSKYESQDTINELMRKHEEMLRKGSREGKSQQESVNEKFYQSVDMAEQSEV